MEYGMARTPKVVEDRREQILEAALRVFARNGYARSTNKDVAQEAGITPGLIYHYFPSKEALLKAVIEEASPVQGIRSLKPEMLDQPVESFLRFVLRQMLEIAESERFLQLVRIMLPEMLHNASFSPAGATTLQEATLFMKNYLAGKMSTGELRQADPGMVAQVLMSSTSGFVLRRVVFQDPAAMEFTHDEIVEGILSTSLQGILPR
jgi:AcrR family transcriptional regulator